MTQPLCDTYTMGDREYIALRMVPCQSSRPVAAILNIALRLHALGLSLIPLKPQSKEPDGDVLPKDEQGKPTWKPFQTTRATEAQLREWFSNGNRNVANVLGKISGVVAVDPDTPEQDAWCDAHLPPTPMMTQASKCKHRYFRLPTGHWADVAIPANLTVGNLKIEVKRDGQYLVAPGSVHPTGHVYTEVEPWPTSLDSVPEFPMAGVDAHVPKQSEPLPQTIAEGRRNETLFREGCRLRRLGWREVEIADALSSLNKNRCAPAPLDAHELKAIAHRCATYEPAFAPTAPRVVVVESLPVFLARTDHVPEPAWLIPGLIPDAGTTLWHGQPRDFKTMLALAAGVALARGDIAFASERFRVARTVTVAYFSEEDLEAIVAARLRWLTRKAGVPDGFYPFVRKSLSFDVEDDQEFILDCIAQCGAEVVIFDPVRSYTGLSDKGPADLRPVTLFLRRIQNETRAKTVSLVHHDTKPPAVAKDNDARGRSQQASGGGIFSISDCPVSFKKLDWNRVAVIPEDYKISGDPRPFEVTFETAVWHDETGAPRFGPREAPWVRPVAVTKGEHDMVDGRLRTKVLEFLASTAEWHTAPEIEAGAHIGKDKAPSVLKVLLAERLVERVTGGEAQALGRSAKAQLWRASGGTLLCDADL